MGPQSQCHRVAHKGVTLLEVLASLLVLTVGLLGMAALLPVGRFEVSEAQKLDRASSLGRAAFRDLHIRGFLRPEMWLNPVPGTSGTNLERFVVQPTNGLGAGTNLPWNNLYTPGDTVRPPMGPIVLDPLGVFPVNLPGQTVRGIGVTEGQEPSAGHLNAIRTFPYGLLSFSGIPGTAPEAKAPRIARVTLREAAGMPSLMRRDLAERYFMSAEDVVFGTPERSGDKPVRIYQEVTVGPAANNPEFRMPRFNPVDRSAISAQAINPGMAAFQGDFTWFVTFSPSLTEILGLDELQEFGGDSAFAPRSQGPITSPFRAPTGRSATLRQYNASVVVVHKRQLLDLSAASFNDLRRAERMAWVDFTGGNGARLRLVSGGSMSDAEANLTVRANEWIGLIGSYIHPSVRDGGGVLPVWTLLWYRVMATSDQVEELGNPGSGIYVRNIVLSGRNWGDQQAGLLDADGDPKTGMTAFGVVIPGIVGVYEKTITIDSGSSYSMSPY